MALSVYVVYGLEVDRELGGSVFLVVVVVVVVMVV